jgi:hypothetical protein
LCRSTGWEKEESIQKFVVCSKTSGKSLEPKETHIQNAPVFFFSTPELNPPAQRCLTKFFTADFVS